ncbi:hypothetical protein H6G51_15165 [Limnothrix sp. FACHB-708]|uniref:hypothetical protein n=1 Tax=unclassified Limnothrix TaxID=2632864 RepID=UPI0016828D68|nr:MULTISPECIES: hypothetical protein [unclassified Limnothrix]MBD2554625.1 hypothetical protein [Limnothrix sp. FACHB-708]MBD2591658.1 hypothetical protein [Limnothrix sp. FACHB-406]
MKLSENQLRDLIYEKHKESLFKIIKGRRDPIVWNGDGFPPISILLQQIVEEKINRIIDGLESLILSAKELRLEKQGNSTTRIDLFGNSECIGLTIIELKKSKQTERQAFTELLAYANHFYSIFPGLAEQGVNTILIAPMETRTVRDAFVQEVLWNNHSSAAFIPSEQDNGEIILTVYYPDSSYYQWFENNLLDDRSMYTVAIEFEELSGWIDTDKDNKQIIPDYSRKALNTISSSISHRLEAEGFHAIVYATQNWGEIADILPHPNVIYAVFINPFASFRNSCDNDVVYGETAKGRSSEIQSIYDQLDEDSRKYWFSELEYNFHGLAIQIVKSEFDRCFLTTDHKKIESEISLPDWYGVKTSVISSVFTHNLDIYETGLLRKIYLRYIEYIYLVNFDNLYYADNIPKYSYHTFRSFLPVWEILRKLGIGAGDSGP